MDTEEEKAYTALDMFCRAAEKATGDYWEIQQMENGDLAVVQTFKAATETMNDPKISDEEKKLMITGVLFCMSSGGLVDLAKHLVLTFSRGPGLAERGRGEWIVVAQVERDRSFLKRRSASGADRCGYLLVKDRATMRKSPRLLALGDFAENDEYARESLLSQCWKILGAESVEEVALRWAILGDDVVLNWFDGNWSWTRG